MKHIEETNEMVIETNEMHLHQAGPIAYIRRLPYPCRALETRGD